MKPATLRTGSLLAMISAILTLPFFVISLQLAGDKSPGTQHIQLIMHVSGAFIFVVLTGMLRRFLKTNCLFRGVDNLLLLLIVLNSIYAVIYSYILLVPQMEERLDPFLLTVLIMLGLAQALFGYRLRRMGHELGGFKRLFCTLNILTGICVASLVLVPFGVLSSAVSDVLLATIFTQEASRWDMLSNPAGHVD